MSIYIAVSAAIACSLCNGISTIQQKVGADHQKDAHSLDLTLLIRLLGDTPYLFGTFLEIAGYGLSLVALQVLPLFLVQSVVAASIVVTTLGERVFLHKRLGGRTYVAVFAVLVGLLLLAVSSVPGRATQGNPTVRLLIELLPLPIIIAGLIFIYKKTRVSAFMLAALGGLAFGNTSTIGRILTYPHPLWKLAESPLIYSLIASAIIGQYLFTVSLQRVTATKSNAIMITLQTLGPAICGLLFFNDQVRSGYEWALLLGTLIVIIGSGATAVDESPIATI